MGEGEIPYWPLCVILYFEQIIEHHLQTYIIQCNIVYTDTPIYRQNMAIALTERLQEQ